jgi:hypothetical protein
MDFSFFSKNIHEGILNLCAPTGAHGNRCLCTDKSPYGRFNYAKVLKMDKNKCPFLKIHSEIFLDFS